ncbi:MAG: glycosyltransferase family 4 protein, partial [Phycisphaerae bacterium]|nr:glycosyltransferase family 4 protein [Phycisphaerae bacterium]
MADRPLRILHLVRNADTGGLLRYVVDLATAMHDAGHSVTIASDTGPAQDLLDRAPFQTIRIPLMGGPRSFRNCVRLLHDMPCDILHAHYRRATLLGRRLQKTNSVPLLYTLHLSHMKTSWWRRALNDFGDHTHVAAEEARQWLIDEEHIPAEQITLIPHGIDTARFPQRDDRTMANARAELNLPPDALVAAYVGRFDEPKNESWLIDLALQMPSIHLVLAGAGPHERALEQSIEKNNLNGRVKMIGYRDPLLIYQAADALLLPSSREGFALACAEAMSVGVPVLRTRTSGTAAMIIEGETGQS